MKFFNKKKAISKGSITVETSIVLPIFIFAICTLLYFFEALTLNVALRDAGVKAAKEASAYGYLLKSVKIEAEKNITMADGLSDVATGLISSSSGSLWFKNRVKHYVPKGCDNFSIIKGGYDGITFLGSQTFDTDENVQIVMYYELNLPMLGDFSPDIPIVQKIVMKSFSGSEIERVERISKSDDKEDEDGTEEEEKEEEEEEEEEEEKIVFVSVLAGKNYCYHYYDDCIHIVRNPVAMPYSAVPKSYRKGCKHCAKGVKPEPTDLVYYTKGGGKFHMDANCSEITRSIESMTLEEAENKGYRLCTTCKLRHDGEEALEGGLDLGKE
jgi:hypothetical protein